MISYDPLWRTLQRKHKTAYMMLKAHIVGDATLANIRQGKPVSLLTLDKICQWLRVPLGAVVTIVLDQRQPAVNDASTDDSFSSCLYGRIFFVCK